MRYPIFLYPQKEKADQIVSDLFSPLLELKLWAHFSTTLNNLLFVVQVEIEANTHVIHLSDFQHFSVLSEDEQLKLMSLINKAAEAGTIIIMTSKLDPPHPISQISRVLKME